MFKMRICTPTFDIKVLTRILAPKKRPFRKRIFFRGEDAFYFWNVVREMGELFSDKIRG